MWLAAGLIVFALLCLLFALACLRLSDRADAALADPGDAPPLTAHVTDWSQRWPSLSRLVVADEFPEPVAADFQLWELESGWRA